MSTPVHGGSEGRFTRAVLVDNLRSSRARDVGLDATAAHVREKLMVFANGDRETFVSVDTLAGAINRSEKTVRRAIGRLCERGDLSRRIEKTRWGQRNVYKLAGGQPANSAGGTPPTPSMQHGACEPSLASAPVVPMGTAIMPSPPDAETLLSDRDQKNDPPQPPGADREPVVADVELRQSECSRSGSMLDFLRWTRPEHARLSEKDSPKGSERRNFSMQSTAQALAPRPRGGAACARRSPS